MRLALPSVVGYEVVRGFFVMRFPAQNKCDYRAFKMSDFLVVIKLDIARYRHIANDIYISCFADRASQYNLSN